MSEAPQRPVDKVNVPGGVAVYGKAVDGRCPGCGFKFLAASKKA
jgi:hypothetical protein